MDDPPAADAPSSAPWVKDFHDLSHEWRRLFAELLGTFLLVLVAVGGEVVAAATGIAVPRVAAVAVPGLMVMAVILSMGRVSGAHLNPVVSVAFALRREFPWRRVPGYVLAQVAGGIGACLLLAALFGHHGSFGATLPGPGVDEIKVLVIEAVITLGLVTVILGTASSAQNVGPLSAIAVGGYIALAGIWAGAVGGASMNPVRSFAPALIRGNLDHYWVYLVGPLLGALAAVGCAWVLRGPGGDAAAAAAARGDLQHPEQTPAGHALG